MGIFLLMVTTFGDCSERTYLKTLFGQPFLRRILLMLFSSRNSLNLEEIDRAQCTRF